MFFNKKSTHFDTVESLKAEIGLYDRTIKRHSDDHNTVSLKADALMKIFQLTGEETYLNEALNCYNLAIRIAPENVLYIVNRATCYINLKQNDLASADLEKAKSLLPTLDDVVVSAHIRSEVEKIEQYLSNTSRSTLG